MAAVHCDRGSAGIDQHAGVVPIDGTGGFITTVLIKRNRYRGLLGGIEARADALGQRQATAFAIHLHHSLARIGAHQQHASLALASLDGLLLLAIHRQHSGIVEQASTCTSAASAGTGRPPTTRPTTDKKRNTAHWTKPHINPDNCDKYWPHERTRSA